MISGVTMAGVTRRRLIAGFGGLLAVRPLVAKSRISRSRVSAVTDELGKTQADAIAVVQQYRMQAVELRYMPGTQKEFAALTGPELKRAVSELGVVKLKVTMLHASKLTPEAITAAGILGAPRLFVAGADSDVISKNMSALEQAKLQLLVSGTVPDQFPSKAVGLDWDPVKSPDGYVKGRVLNVRVRILEEAGWRRRMESLERDDYTGGISLETTGEKSDDALHDLLRLIDSL
jgi:hypothetical protein